jgi:hypothetical protein
MMKLPTTCVRQHKSEATMSHPHILKFYVEFVYEGQEEKEKFAYSED